MKIRHLELRKIVLFFSLENPFSSVLLFADSTFVNTVCPFSEQSFLGVLKTYQGGTNLKVVYSWEQQMLQEYYFRPGFLCDKLRCSTSPWRTASRYC